jgi:hypothetical protein
MSSAEASELKARTARSEGAQRWHHSYNCFSDLDDDSDILAGEFQDLNVGRTPRN